MPAKPIHQHWQGRINELAANDPRPGPYRIEALLAEEANTPESLPPPPVANTIRRYLEVFYRKSKEEQELYRYLRWPQSMEAGLVPWEASAAVLELLGIHQQFDLLAPYVRALHEDPMGPLDLSEELPSVRLARWYWRVTQAAPDLPASLLSPESLGYEGPTRHDIARTLTLCETVGIVLEPLRDCVKAYLAYAPWRSPLHAALYDLAIAQGQIPGFDHAPQVSVNIRLKPYPLEAMREPVGDAVAEHWAAVWHKLRNWAS